MTRYLVDTTLLAAFLMGRSVAVALMTPWLEGREATTSILVYGEIVEYLVGFSDFPARHFQLRRLLR